MSLRLFVFTVNYELVANEKSYLLSSAYCEQNLSDSNSLMHRILLSFTVDKIVTDKQMGGKVFIFQITFCTHMTYIN